MKIQSKSSEDQGHNNTQRQSDIPLRPFSQAKKHREKEERTKTWRKSFVEATRSPRAAASHITRQPLFHKSTGKGERPSAKLARGRKKPRGEKLAIWIFTSSVCPRASSTRCVVNMKCTASSLLYRVAVEKLRIETLCMQNGSRRWVEVLTCLV